MRKLSRITALLIATLVFFLLVLTGIFSQNVLNLSLGEALLVILKALIGFVIFYFLGLIAVDLVLKAIQSAVEDAQVSKLQGGLISHFVEEKTEEPPPSH
jgi:hypothetical protein